MTLALRSFLLAGLVFSGVLLTARVAAAQSTAQSTAQALELPAGVTVEHDGAGGLRVLEGERVLLHVDLRWMSAVDVSPSGIALSLVGGARRAGSDEGDVHLAAIPSAGFDGVLLASRLRHWPYFHVDEIAFVDAALRTEGMSPPIGAAALGIRTERPWELRRLQQRPHLSVGRAPLVSFDLVQIVHERPDGDRLYLGIVRLDRRQATRLDEGEGLVWEAGTAPSWPLAILAARTRNSLEYLAGQALLTYDGAGERAGAGTSDAGWWKVPPLCGRCREPRIEDLRVELRARDGLLQLRTRLRSGDHLEHVCAEGLRVEGVALGRYLQRVDAQEAEYAIPSNDSLARQIVDRAIHGDLDLEVWTHAEIGARPQRLDLHVEPGTAEALAEALAGARAAQQSLDEVLPSYLSPALVSSWPNPFRNETTIEVTVPATLGEAFELDATALARVDPTEPVPFGANPTVRVRVFNVGGQLIQTLSEDERNVGRFAVQWNGADLQGRPVAAGAYYVNVEIGDWSVTRRVLRLAP